LFFARLIPGCDARSGSEENRGQQFFYALLFRVNYSDPNIFRANKVVTVSAPLLLLNYASRSVLSRQSVLKVT